MKLISTILFISMFGLSSSQEDGPTFIFAIQSNDCVNCYLNTKTIFNNYSKKYDYKILINNISEDNIIGFISKNLNFSPSIKKIDVNNDSFEKYSNLKSSTLSIIFKNNIIYKKEFKLIDNKEFNLIDSTLLKLDIKKLDTKKGLNNDYNYIKYLGNKLLSPYVKDDSIYIFNNIENKLYKIIKDNTSTLINLNTDITDTLLKSIIYNSDYISSDNKTSIITNFEKTKATMNRTFEIDNMFYSKDFIYFSARVYLSVNLNGRKAVIFPTTLFKYGYDGKLVKSYDFEWALDSQLSKYLYFYDVEVINNDKFNIQEIDFDDTLNKIVEINLANKNYRRPASIIKEIIKPSYLAAKSRFGNQSIYFYRSIKISNKTYYYHNQIPFLFENNKSKIFLDSTSYDSSNINLAEIYIDYIENVDNLIYVYFVDNYKQKTYINIYNKKFKLIKKIEVYNGQIYRCSRKDKKIIYYKFEQSKELKLINFNF